MTVQRKSTLRTPLLQYQRFHSACTAVLQVDLEHNQYRSFQGLTCLMQISTRTEDFVIDTLKLRIHIGPYLRDLFKDPTKRKVSVLIILFYPDFSYPSQS